MNFYSPTEQNTYVLIITFNPDFRLIDSLNIVTKIFNNIVVIDNNSTKEVKSIIKSKNVTLIENDENLGIAQALNIGAKHCIKNGAKWMLMLDQDTIPRIDILDFYKSIFSNYPNKNKISQIGSAFTSVKKREINYSIVTTLITSGSLLSLEAYKVAGDFRNDFFIDSVDFEYSLRLLKHGFVNLQNNEIVIDHRLGNIKVIDCLFFKIRSTNHNPIRRYYMARNHVLITILYFFDFPFWIIKKNIFFIKSIFEIVLVDDQKKSKLKNTLKGFKDGFLNKEI